MPIRAGILWEHFNNLSWSVLNLYVIIYLSNAISRRQFVKDYGLLEFHKTAMTATQ